MILDVLGSKFLEVCNFFRSIETLEVLNDGVSEFIVDGGVSLRNPGRKEVLDVVCKHFSNQNKGTVLEDRGEILARSCADVDHVYKQLESLDSIDCSKLEEAGSIVLFENVNLDLGEVVVEKETEDAFLVTG